MSQLNSSANLSNVESAYVKCKQGNEDANHLDNTSNNEDLNDEYILSLLNNSGDSEVHDIDTKSVSNIFSELNSGSSGISNDDTSTHVNETNNNSDNALNHAECGRNRIASKQGKKVAELTVEQKKEYRDSDSSWIEDEDSSSSSSSDSDFHFEPFQQNSLPKVNCVKTKGELDIEDLPPIEYLKISVDKDDLRRIGRVHAIVSKLVVIQATKDEKPLDIDSVLFLAPNKPLGRIFEVFGPVIEPFYTVLFNAPEDIIEKGVEVGSDVFYAPQKNEITSYVFIDMLRQQKGSDASWKDNNEPPEEHLDFSDDEQERAAKLKRRGKGRVREYEDDEEVQIIPYKISPLEKGTFNYTSYTQSNSCETLSVRNLTQDNRNSIQSNRNYVQKNNDLDNVPVWISAPPPYLEPKPLPSQSNATSTTPVQSFQLKQAASLPVQNHIQLSSVPPNSSQSQFRQGPLLLNPKQPFVPRQPPNFNPQKLLTQSPIPPPNGNIGYFPPQRPSHQMIQNASGQILFQNAHNNAVANRHIFGQITPVGVMSPVPPMSPAPQMSPAMFSPCPSPAIYMQPNAYSPLSPAALSPNRFWLPQNQHSPSFTNVQSPPPSAPLTIQIPTFSSPPPVFRFSAANNYSTPPPPLPSHNNFSTPLYSSRF